MKALKFFRGGGILLALLIIGSCDNSDPENNISTEYDDAYYASLASVSSSNSEFTSSEEGGTISFTAEGGSVVVTVDCGTDWTAFNGASDYFTSTVTSSTSLTISADRNTVAQEKAGAITLYTVDQRINFATITVIQNAYGAPEITAEITEWNVPAVGELSTEIAVEATADWTAETAGTWLTVEKTDGGVSLTASENEDTSERSTKVTLTCTDGVKTVYEYINVSQDAKVYITLSGENVTLAGIDDSVHITVDSNYDWDFSYDKDNGWYTAAREDDGIVITSTADNQTEGNFESVITITAGDGAKNVTEAQITIIEENNADALILVYTITSANTTETLPISGTVNCTVTWGDGSSETVTAAKPTHSYAAAGEYTVVISGTVTALSSSNIASSAKATELTAVKKWGKTGLTTMANAFAYCKNLTSIPNDTREAFAEVTTFTNAFQYCTGLTEIPDGLLTYATKATTISYLFDNCSGITSIPSGLFDKCTRANTFYETFAHMTALTTVPNNLFVNTAASSLYGLFYGCTSLASVPENLFTKCSSVSTLAYVFNDCTSLTSVPANLFSSCSGVTTFMDAFYGCTSLTSIPENLFSSCTKAKTFSYLFKNCTALTSVPGGLFSNCTQAETFAQAFSGCKALTQIGSGLFANTTSVTTFHQTFQNCTALTSIPENLFASCKDVTNFGAAFDGCSALTGESAYDVIRVNGQQVNVHLYERENYTGSGYTAPTTYSDCYSSCKNLDDYSSIPQEWGGSL